MDSLCHANRGSDAQASRRQVALRQVGLNADIPQGFQIAGER